MPTRAGWGLLAAAAATLVAARVFSLTELYVFGATALALLAACVATVATRRPTIQVVRAVTPHRVHLGGQCRIELRVTNSATRTTPVMVLQEPIEGTFGAQVSIPPLDAGEAISATYRLPAMRRGLMPVGPLSVTRSDPFGLAARTDVIVERITVTVLPAVDLLGPVGTGGGMDDPLAGLAHEAMGPSGEEDFASLRDYVVGDDLRRVHWASSARRGDLLVREDDPPWRGHVTVVLDARTDHVDPACFEAAVSAAASVLHGVSVHGDRARLVITDGTDTGLVDATAERDLLMEHLALVEQHQGGRFRDLRPPGRGAPGGLVVVTGEGGGGPTRAQDRELLVAASQHYAVTRLVMFTSAGATTDFGDLTSAGSVVRGGRGAIRTITVSPGASFATAWRTSFNADRSTGAPV